MTTYDSCSYRPDENGHQINFENLLTTLSTGFDKSHNIITDEGAYSQLYLIPILVFGLTSGSFTRIITYCLFQIGCNCSTSGAFLCHLGEI